MGRTALELTRKEWQAYRPGTKTGGTQVQERWERARHAAQDAAEVLREQFGATRVVAFGSLAHRDAFTHWVARLQQSSDDLYADSVALNLRVLCRAGTTL